MREIVSGRLWLGSSRDGRDVERLMASGITTVVHVAVEEPSPILPRTLTYCHFPICDGLQEEPTILRIAIGTVAALLKNRIPTLIYCGAGMSRSPAIAAAAITLVEGGSPEDRLRQIVSGHPCDVSSALWAAVKSALSITTD
jgi:hypothetical protein